MSKKQTECYVPMLDISKLHEALIAAEEALATTNCEPAHKQIQDALRHLARIVKWKPADLVQYKGMDGKWQNGVVVALMICEPGYICGDGDDRENVPNDKLLACPRKFVRARKPAAKGKK